MEPEQKTRIGLVGALVLVLAVVAVLLLRGGSGYTLHARFLDAGQLVKGDLVEVGGKTIGTVKDIVLADDNQADVVLKITDDQYKNLHRGTTATIRAVGLSGVANRFVEIDPGPPQAPEIGNGGTLTTSETKPIVDLDELLDALDQPTRDKLQALIKNGAKLYAGDAAQQSNAALAYLNPALSQLRSFSGEVAADDVALAKLIRSSAITARALASRSGELQDSIGTTAGTLRAVANERAALEDSLSRAPAVLRQAQGTFRGLRGTLAAVNPALRDARPAAAPLARTLRDLVPTAQAASPVLADLDTLLPSLRTSLQRMPALSKVALPALGSTATTLHDALPIFTGLRPYAPDLIGGLNAFGGNTAAYYDANGHFARVSFNTSTQAVGILGSLPGVTSLLPNLRGYKTGKGARCPGGAADRAPDGSNPWQPDPGLCDAADSLGTAGR